MSSTAASHKGADKCLRLYSIFTSDFDSGFVQNRKQQS